MANYNASDPVVYPTYGVHNKWTMYRVFNNYVDNPPPYDGKPPAGLKEGVDYQVSYGISYYDSTWRGPNGEEGAMMEYYDEWSLPIFPIDNHYSSAFISLGDKAYFLTYDKDRPKGMPPICLFSSLNHPPRRDFIKHLPYSLGDSRRLGGRVQGYSFWTSPDGVRPPIQVGASPDRTADRAILFGYAFKSAWELDAVDKSAPPYRHPQSFYFSGYPGTPPDAPIVSQNFIEFAMVRPDPAETWDLVAKFSGGKEILPACNLFGSPESEAALGNEPLTWAGKKLEGGL